MARKDYELIAKQIKGELDKTEKMHGEKGWPRYDALSELTRGLADALKLDNPRFDKNRFYAACGFLGSTA